jgi:hypothetical protein
VAFTALLFANISKRSWLRTDFGKDGVYTNDPYSQKVKLIAKTMEKVRTQKRKELINDQV